MSVAPNLCCDKTKNRGTYTRVTIRSELQVDQSFASFPSGFPGGVWKLRGSTCHFSSSSLYQMSTHSNQSNQTKLTKPNQTRTSPAGSHTPNQTNGKDMPRNQKPNSKTVPKRWQSDAQKSKPNGKNTPRGWQRVAQKSKGKWHKCPRCDFLVPLDL